MIKKIELIDKEITYSIRQVTPDELNVLTGRRLVLGLLYFNNKEAYIIQTPRFKGVSLEQLGLIITILCGGYAQKIRLDVDMCDDNPDQYITTIKRGDSWGIKPDYADKWYDAFRRNGGLLPSMWAE